MISSASESRQQMLRRRCLRLTFRGTIVQLVRALTSSILRRDVVCFLRYLVRGNSVELRVLWYTRSCGGWWLVDSSPLIRRGE